MDKYSEHISAKALGDFDLGHNGPPRNTRFRITTDAELTEALSLKKDGWVLLWMTVNEGSSRKRAASQSSANNCATACNTEKVPCVDGKLSNGQLEKHTDSL